MLITYNSTTNTANMLLLISAEFCTTYTAFPNMIFTNNPTANTTLVGAFSTQWLTTNFTVNYAFTTNFPSTITTFGEMLKVVGFTIRFTAIITYMYMLTAICNFRTAFHTMLNAIRTKLLPTYGTCI
jgi:hypothetical protein